MKKNLFIIITLITIGINAQISVKKSSISTSGGTMTSGSQEIIFTISETNIQEADIANIHLSEGFIGPDIAEALGISDYGILSGISVYPNPVKDLFRISFSKKGTYELFLYNLQGKQIIYRQSQNLKEIFDIAHLNATGYILIVIDRKNKLTKSFKIIKE